MSYKPTGRPRGGQPRNQNGLRHGLYSKLISVRDAVELDHMPPDQSDHELALARVRLKGLVLRQHGAAPEQWLGYEKAIQHYIDRITVITYKNAILGRDQNAGFVTVTEMIRQANIEQNVN